MVVGHEPFALNVVITGASMCSASASTASRNGRAPLPADDRRVARRRAAASMARSSSSAGGSDRMRPRCGPARGARAAPRDPGSSCTSSGRIRWATSRLTIGVLHRQRRELGGVRRRQHGLAPLGDGVERRRERQLLERARAEHLRLHLARQGEDRNPVDLGVPEPGQQVGRAGSRDREARGRAARELRVAATPRTRRRPRDGCRRKRSRPSASALRSASAMPRLEWPTMPKTVSRPQSRTARRPPGP